MQSKPHGKTIAQLKAMKMPALLKLVTDHHLAQHIHLYRRMGKPALVKALQWYKQIVPASDPMKRKPAPKKRVQMPKPAKSKARGKRNPSLYTKEEGGVLGGARSDFERVYGKMGTRAKPKATTNVSPPPAKRTRRKPKRLVEQ